MTAITPDLRAAVWCPDGAAAPRPGRRLRRAALRGFAALVLVLLAAVLGAVGVARLSGWATVTVRGASMGDAHPIGSLVLAEPVPRATVGAGDVVVVGREGTPVLHRVLELERAEGRLAARTKGDANAKPDPNLFVFPPQVLVARHTIPYLGYVLAFGSTPVGWFMLMVLPAAVLAASLLVQIWSPESYLPRIHWRSRNRALAV